MSLVDPAPSVSQHQDASTSSGHKLQTKEQARGHYVQALRQVIDESDVVLLVLDARDPEGCRSRLVEEEVRRRESEGKRLVFVLNKIGAFRRSWSTVNTYPSRRPHSQRQRPSVVTVLAPYNTYITIPLRIE